MPEKTHEQTKLNDMRCCRCNAKLAEINLVEAVVKIKCTRCGTVNELIAGIEKQSEGRLKESYSVEKPDTNSAIAV